MKTSISQPNMKFKATTKKEYTISIKINVSTTTAAKPRPKRRILFSKRLQKSTVKQAPTSTKKRPLTVENNGRLSQFMPPLKKVRYCLPEPEPEPESGAIDELQTMISNLHIGDSNDTPEPEPEHDSEDEAEFVIPILYRLTPFKPPTKSNYDFRLYGRDANGRINKYHGDPIYRRNDAYDRSFNGHAKTSKKEMEDESMEDELIREYQGKLRKTKEGYVIDGFVVE